MLKYAQAETTEGHGRERGVEGSDKVLVEPLCFLDLEAYSSNRGKVFLGKIYDEADTKVIEPLLEVCVSVKVLKQSEHDQLKNTQKLPGS
jgi:hypothetical protein